MENRNLLLVDDDSNVLKSLERELRPCGYQLFTARSAKEGLDILSQQDIGVVVSDMKMPGMDGIEFLEAARQLSAETVRLLLTGHGNFDNAISAINRSHLFGYLIKPWDAVTLQTTLAKAFANANLIRENKRLLELIHEQNIQLRFINENLEKAVRERTCQLEEAVSEGIEMLALAAEAKDDVTGGHIYRIRNLTRAICLALDIPEKEAEQISFFSIIHDVGKIHIPDHILKKEGALNEEEWRIMKTHTTAGEKILGHKSFYQLARWITRSHHERWDGSGYPDGLQGEKIPLAARIVAVADVYDSLTSVRPYKPAWPVEQALSHMEVLKGTHFDPKVLAAFFAVIKS